MEKFIIKQNKKLRDKKYLRIVNKKIQSYIKNGCIGSLWLFKTPINKLPNNLKKVSGFLSISYTKISELPNDIVIEGDLFCYGTPLSEKYNREEIKSKYNIHGKVLFSQ